MLKIFFTSDLHGSDVCFRKFLDAGSTYAVDALIVGGDISGKLVVPIVELADRFRTSYQGRSYTLSSIAQLEEFERTVCDRGHYPVRVEGNDDGAPVLNSAELACLFVGAMRKRVARWLEMAESRLRGGGIECYMMLGNDDPGELVELLDQSDVVVNPDGKRLWIRETIEMVSLGYSNPTPFNSHRELPEVRIESLLDELANQLSDVRSAIFNVHVPPHGSGLDSAPELDENRRVKSRNGEPRLVPVGSTAVRNILLRWQPLLGLHGHVHESRGSMRLGDTLCINPGSSYSDGLLHGAIITIDEGRVRSHQLVTC